jgi:hypothetical protein
MLIYSLGDFRDFRAANYIITVTDMHERES